MRITPDKKFRHLPCSYVAVGSAYEDIRNPDKSAKPRYLFDAEMPDGLKNDGYLTLAGANKFMRQYLPVRKKQTFKKAERPKLKDFLTNNSDKCCVCVLGHFIYVKGKDYYSFFANENDDVVCVWYLD